jgi:DNA relaxase NicK
MTSAPSTVYAAVDWLTLTTEPGDDAQAAYEIARELAGEALGEGDELRAWSSHGYKGFSAPHVRYGAKGDEALVELSGHVADRYWKQLLPYARNVSRLDTCVDVTHASPVSGLAEQAYHAPAVALRPGMPTVRKYLYAGTDGGSTCYVGAPSSDRRGRLYDKHVESGGEFPPGTWRYEVQERRHMGRATARALDGTDDVRGAIAAHVCSFFSKRGVVPWFQSDCRDLSSQPRRSSPDVLQFVNWLHLQVAPGIRRWSNRGHTAAILAALELDASGVRA